MESLELIVIHKLNNTINTNGLTGYIVDENVGGVHILKGDALGDVVHTIAVPVVAETL